MINYSSNGFLGYGLLPEKIPPFLTSELSLNIVKTANPKIFKKLKNALKSFNLSLNHKKSVKIIMEDAFKPLSLPIKKLFMDADSFYRIPQYQRPYKWEDEQVEKLWDDIYEAYENDEKNYFLGSVITAKPRDDGESDYMDVVDGQQRLTTLMITFCVLRDLLPTINEQRPDINPQDVNIKMLKSAIGSDGDAKRLKLVTHRQHQTDFESIILNGDTSKLKKPNKREVRTDEEPKHKFINTAVLIKEKFEKLDENKGRKIVNRFVNFIFNKVEIIRIDCKSSGFAIKLFQVLNDRGMDLTPADLIKSYLFGELDKKYKGDLGMLEVKEEQFTSDWHDMEQTINSCDISVNDLFIIYAYYTLGENPKKSVYDVLQVEFKGKNPNTVIGDIKKFASTYYEDIWLKGEEVIYSFRYIPWGVYWRAILLSALHDEYEDEGYDELKLQLRRFYYLYWIGGKTLSPIKQISFNLIKWVKEKKPISVIIAALNKKIEADNIVELATKNLTSNYIALEKWCKPLLIMMEYNSVDNSKLSYIELDSKLQLEHILPVKYKLGGWDHFKKETAEQWLQSAGNITLLSGHKNIKASNNSFSKKMAVYKGEGKNDKVSAFKITQKIVSDYESKTYNEEWTLDSMKDRREWFYTEAAELLDIDFNKLIEQHEQE